MTSNEEGKIEYGHKTTCKQCGEWIFIDPPEKHACEAIKAKLHQKETEAQRILKSQQGAGE